MAYLMEEKFDLSELLNVINIILPDSNEDNSFITADNVALAETSLRASKEFLLMRQRKRKVEEESYRIAKEASFGWRTEKMFRRTPVFEDDDSEEPWWKKPELSKEKKAEQLRAAEREVKFQLSNKKFVHQNRARFSPQNPALKFNQNLNSPQPRLPFPYTRTDNRKCYWCHGVGHISTRCPAKFQQQSQQNRNLPQLLPPGQGNARAAGN